MWTGAIFARGSCSVLKWMALFGVMIALGAGAAAAQTFAPDTSFDGDGVKVTVGKVTEGGSAELTVAVKGKVTPSPKPDDDRNIVITVGVSAATDGTDSTKAAEDDDFTFNLPANPSEELGFGKDTKGENVEKSATFLLHTTHDGDAEDEAVTLTFSVSGEGLSISLSEGLTIDDDETQTYVVTVTTDDPTEGKEIVATVKAEPAHEDGAAELRLHLDDADYSLDSPTNAGFAIGVDTAISGATATHTATITTPSNDKNRVEDTVTLSLYSGTAGNSNLEDSEAIKVADANALPAVTVTAIVLDEDGDPVDPQPDMVDSITEGQMIDLKVAVVDKDGDAEEAAENLSVKLLPTGSADDRDYRLSMHPVTIASGAESATIELTAEDDQDVGLEMLMFDAEVSGDAANGTETRMSAGVLSLSIEDNTSVLVQAKSDDELTSVIAAAMAKAGDDGLNPGECVEVMAGDLFTIAAGTTVTYASSSDNASVTVTTSGGTVEVCAVDAGEANVTVTATGTPPSGATSSQTVSNVAHVMFAVTVDLAELAITLSGPEDMNIAEGMSATVTATANRAVTEDTVVELIQTDGTASPADFTAEPITIMAGETMGTTMVMAVEDETMEDMEMLTLEGRVGAMKTNAVSFYLWDAAVPALPIIAQLLLAAFLAIGGYRRYLRR